MSKRVRRPSAAAAAAAAAGGGCGAHRSRPECELEGCRWDAVSRTCSGTSPIAMLPDELIAMVLQWAATTDREAFLNARLVARKWREQLGGVPVTLRPVVRPEGQLPPAAIRAALPADRRMFPTTDAAFQEIARTAIGTMARNQRGRIRLVMTHFRIGNWMPAIVEVLKEMAPGLVDVYMNVKAEWPIMDYMAFSNLRYFCAYPPSRPGGRMNRLEAAHLVEFGPGQADAVVRESPKLKELVLYQCVEPLSDGVGSATVERLFTDDMFTGDPSVPERFPNLKVLVLNSAYPDPAVVDSALGMCMRMRSRLVAFVMILDDRVAVPERAAEVFMACPNLECVVFAHFPDHPNFLLLHGVDLAGHSNGLRRLAAGEFGFTSGEPFDLEYNGWIKPGSKWTGLRFPSEGVSMDGTRW